MDALKKILALVLKSTDLNAEDRKALEAFKPDDYVTRTEAQAQLDRHSAGARKDAEAKLAKATTDLEAAQQKIKALEDGQGTEKDKLTRQIESLTGRVEQLNTALETSQKDTAAATRQSRIRAIGSAMNWNRDVVDTTYEDLLLTQALGDLSTEDLENTALTKPILERLQADKPSLFKAAAPGGTGDHHTPAPSAATKHIDGKGLLNIALSGDLEAAEKAVSEAAAGVAAGDTDIS